MIKYAERKRKVLEDMCGIIEEIKRISLSGSKTLILM